MSSLSERTVPRGRIVRGREANSAAGVQRSAARIDAGGGLQLDGPVAEHIQQEAHKEGFDAGYADGMRAAERAAAVQEAQRAQEIQTLRAVFADAAQAYEYALGQTLSDLEDALGTAAVMLAEAIIGRELAVAENPGRDAIARALALAPHHLPVTAHLNAEDAQRLGDVSAIFGDRAITVIIDDAVSLGGCVLHVGRTEIDAQLEAAVDRARKALCG